MIEENENEKNLQFIKIIACFVIYSVISVIIVFAFFVSKVEALTYNTRYYAYNNGTSTQLCNINGQDSSCANNTTPPYYLYNYNRVLYGSTINSNVKTTFNSQFMYAIRVSCPYSNDTTCKTYMNYFKTTIPNVWITNSSGTTVSITNYCSNSYTTEVEDLESNGTILKRWRYTLTCDFQIGSNQTSIMWQVKLNDTGSNVKNIGTYYSNTLYSITNNNNEDIIINNNNNTNNIITNNNENTNKITEKQQETTDAVNDLNDTINDDSVDNPSSALNGMASNNTSNSVISDLLLLPVSLFQKILNNINGTCSSFNLGSLFGHNLVLPCINLSNLLGSALYSVIDVLISGIFILSIRKKFVDIFNNITSLKTGGNELE